MEPRPEESRPQDIGWARRTLDKGLRIRRAGWNGKGMWIMLAKPNTRERVHVRPGEEFVQSTWDQFVYIHAANGLERPWVCSQEDLRTGNWRTDYILESNGPKKLGSLKPGLQPTPFGVGGLQSLITFPASAGQQLPLLTPLHPRRLSGGVKGLV